MGRAGYLVHLAGWAVPVLALQVAALRWRYGRRLGDVIRAVLPPVAAVTAWLVAADHLAVEAGIWRFGAAHLLGLELGAVPVEEVLFFLLTNLLVAFGVALLGEGEDAGA